MGGPTSDYAVGRWDDVPNFPTTSGIENDLKFAGEKDQNEDENQACEWDIESLKNQTCLSDVFTLGKGKKHNPNRTFLRGSSS